MKKPTKKDTVRLSIALRGGRQIFENIVGMQVGTCILHRLPSEHEDMERGDRKRYSGWWMATHRATGLSLGVTTKDFDGLYAFLKEIEGDSVLLMLTGKQMESHPEYQEFIDKFNRLRSKYRI